MFSAKTWQQSWQLFCISWNLLNRNLWVLLLPVISLVSLLAIVGGAAGVYWLTGAFDRISFDHGISIFALMTGSAQGVNVFDALLAIATYIAVITSGIYFNAVLVAAAYDLLTKGEATLRSSFATANRRLPEILGWAFFMGTIGFLIGTLRSSNNPIAKAIGFVLGVAWSFVTFLVVPVVVIEGLTPFDAVKRSTELVQKTWGKQIVSRIGLAVLAFPFMLAVMIPICFAAAGGPLVAAIFLAAIFLPVGAAGLFIIQAMEEIFLTALYRFAATGEVSGGYAESTLRFAYKTKDGSSAFGDGPGVAYRGGGPHEVDDFRDTNPWGHRGF